MINFLRKLFGKPERHYLSHTTLHAPDVCACGHTSYWDYNLRTHFEQTGRIGK